jgi:putative ABC transport system ATP-binding protein
MINNDGSKRVEIKLEDVKKRFIMGEVEVPVLNGIDLEIFQGELTVILGPSGSGKSTLLNIIGGIDRPTSGNVIFNQQQISSYSDKQLTEFRRSSVGFVFQFYNLVPTLNAKENVEVSTEVAENPMQPEKALELVDMSERKDFFPAQMSGGQQQRVSIARALAKNPVLMLCDEPTGALDAKTGQVVLKTLTELNATLGTTIVIITHSSSIAKLAHRIVHLNCGVIVRSEENKNRLKVEDISW